MNNSFIDYVDFFDIAYETFQTAPKKLFTKFMRMIINSLHEQSIEIEKQTFQLENMNSIPVDDLDEFYDTIINGIDDMKLLKKKLKEIKTKDILFDELYEQIDKLHTSLVLYMDRMGQLEIFIMTKQQSA